MPLFTKPQFNNVWASTGAKLTPDVAKISQGWVVEIPPHEFDNWMQNRQDALLAHLNQLGIPQWDGTVEYQAGKSYVQGTTTGVVYKALTTHSNVNPETDIQNNWMVAFESSGSALLKANNLSDVPDKAQARVNLGIPTTTFYDNRYLEKSLNFADVPNKASARNNLGLGNISVLNVDDLINIKKTVPFGLQTANGFVVKTGTVTTSTGSSGGRIITFPERFPSTCMFCTIGSTSSPADGVEYVQILSYSATGVDGVIYSDAALKQTGGTVTFTYMAWGW